MTSTSAARAAVTQGMVPSRRYIPGASSTALTGCAPSRRDVVRCEIPTVVNARPSPIATSHRRARSLSGRGLQPADARVVLRQDEDRRQAPARELRVALHQEGPGTARCRQIPPTSDQRVRAGTTQALQSSSGHFSPSSAGPSARASSRHEAFDRAPARRRARSRPASLSGRDS